ncbi:MAG: hypothetical protein K0U41_08540 [Gammaproteobacteria bacterium]|nr:hypothetical protein [Gammaproteobacteria bacterium]
MALFNISSLKQVNNLIEYELPIAGSDGKPAFLSLAPATEDNSEYYSALLRQMSTKSARQQLKKKDTAALIDDNRAKDKLLYSKHIIKGWTNIEDSSGEPVVCTSENVLDFLNALDEVSKMIFTEIRGFASNYQNFLQSEPLDTEDVAKN